MIVPTGRSLRATSTFGPTGTAGVAAAACACSAPAPANMFLAMIAVTAAITSAPTSSMIFLTFMAKSPPLLGPQYDDRHQANWLRNRWIRMIESADRDRDAVRNLRFSGLFSCTVENHDDHRQHASGDRHVDQEREGGLR